MGDSHEAYRAFRKRILNEYKPSEANGGVQHTDDKDELLHPYQVLRKQIVEFREYILRFAQRLLDGDKSDDVSHVQRALGIPASIPLTPKNWSRMRYCWQFFVPLKFRLRHIRSILIQVRTYEGRKYLFDGQFARMFPLTSRRFSPSLDFVLRRLELPCSWKELDDLDRLNSCWMNATYRVGLRNISDIAPYARYGYSKFRGDFALMLVNQKVVTTQQELAWLNYKHDEPHYYYGDETLTQHRTRLIIRLLRTHGVGRQQIAGLFRYPLSLFDPHRLLVNLAIMSEIGLVDLSSVFEETGDLFWCSTSTNWSFVLNTIGAVSATDIKRFKPLLNTYRKPSIDFVERIKKIGAGIPELVQCQSLILAVSDHDNRAVPITELNLLVATPHLMSVDQISQCIDYLSNPNKLPDYLAALARHGYGAASAVLAFQACYRHSSGDSLDVWLRIVGYRGKGIEFEIIAEWVSQALKGGHSDGYEYLLKAVSISDFKQLQQALPIVSLGPNILRFLVEKCGLCSIQAIRTWYFKARGIQGLNSWWQVDDTNNLLLEDAYNRNNFSFFNENQNCISNAIRTRVKEKLGGRPYKADEETRILYDKTYETLSVSELNVLLPILPKVLQKTGGILLGSVLSSAWGSAEVLNAKLAALSPLIDKLLRGCGPVLSELNALEVDAIALLYRASIDSVRNHWPKLVGYETHLSELILRSHYPMKWRGSIRRLKMPLERKSLLSLASAASYAKKLKEPEYGDIFDVCKYLRAKRVHHPASDPWSLASHLGVLLAAAHKDSVLAEWISRDLDVVAHMAEEGAQTFERIEQLEKLFDSTLPDAISQYATDFLRKFNDTDAEFFAERLVGRSSICSAGGGEEQLHEGLRLTQYKVLAVCQRWIAREKKKFVQDNAGDSMTELTAVLSKHPATFFAKETVSLCTRNNIAMWEEERHAHMVVFDQKQRCVAGMALIYMEPVPALHSSKNSLIIRAINPTDDMLATHTTSSIVDAFFDVAIQIAKDNSLAAVAFPYHKGIHLLSNHPAIEKDIDKRFIKPSVGLIYGRLDYEDAEWRVKPRSVNAEFFAYEKDNEKVDELYAIWSGPAEEGMQPVSNVAKSIFDRQ